MKKSMKILIFAAVSVLAATLVYYFFIRPAQLLKGVENTNNPDDKAAFKTIVGILAKDEYFKNGLPSWLISYMSVENNSYGKTYTDALMAAIDSGVYGYGYAGTTEAIHQEAWKEYRKFRDKEAQKTLPL